MRLGISSYTFPWAIGVPGHPPSQPLGAVGLLQRAAQLGVRLAQIADNLPLHVLSAGELQRLKGSADRMGMAIEVGTRGVDTDHLLTYLSLAELLGSPILRVVVDSGDCQPSEGEVVAALRAVTPEFERAGVCLAIENHDRFAARSLLRIVNTIDSPHLGICLDTANSFGALEGPEWVVDVLGPWVVNLHVKDFDIRRLAHRMGFTIEGRPTGQGRLDVPWLLGRLRALGRDPNAILELWTVPEEDLSATIAKEERWAEASVAYLRGLVPT